MFAVAMVALSLAATTRLVVPIMRDLRSKAGDARWLATEANNAQGGLSYEEWCRRTGM
jgi:hypothetical protein